MELNGKTADFSRQVLAIVVRCLTPGKYLYDSVRRGQWLNFLEVGNFSFLRLHISKTISRNFYRSVPVQFWTKRLSSYWSYPMFGRVVTVFCAIWLWHTYPVFFSGRVFLLINDSDFFKHNSGDHIHPPTHKTIDHPTLNNPQHDTITTRPCVFSSKFFISQYTYA